jgi:enoyl-CoA hydratase/carnithine racemase
MLKLPDHGRIITKQQSRQAFASAWREQLEAEAEMGFTQLQSPETVEAIQRVLQRLSDKKRSRL